MSVKESDAALLGAIARELGCDAPLGSMTNHYDGSGMRRLYLCGKKLVADLNNLGLYHDKSKTAVWPAIPPELEGHLVRGLWDGDGHIGRGQFELIGTPALLDGVTAAAAERHTGCSLRRRSSASRDRRVSLTPTAPVATRPSCTGCTPVQASPLSGSGRSS